MTFDEFARDQWETDGGRGPPSDELSDVFPAVAYRNLVAPGFAAELFPSATILFHPNGGTIMTLEPRDIVIRTFHADAECEYSGKQGEAVEISTADGTIQNAVVCFAELTKLLRFRHRQGAKQNGNGQSKPISATIK